MQFFPKLFYINEEQFQMVQTESSSIVFGYDISCHKFLDRVECHFFGRINSFNFEIRNQIITIILRQRNYGKGITFQTVGIESLRFMFALCSASVILHHFECYLLQEKEISVKPMTMFEGEENVSKWNYYIY
jgi:hypothetical protein